MSATRPCLHLPALATYVHYIYGYGVPVCSDDVVHVDVVVVTRLIVKFISIGLFNVRW